MRYRRDDQLPRGGVGLVRYEDHGGVGIFEAAGRILKWRDRHTVKVPRVVLREIESHTKWLRSHTVVPKRRLYKDRYARGAEHGPHPTRGPITWYKLSAVEHVYRAERLAALLRSVGVEMWRVVRQRPGGRLWEDDVQVITRRPRQRRKGEPVPSPGG